MLVRQTHRGGMVRHLDLEFRIYIVPTDFENVHDCWNLFARVAIASFEWIRSKTCLKHCDVHSCCNCRFALLMQSSSFLAVALVGTRYSLHVLKEALNLQLSAIFQERSASAELATKLGPIRCDSESVMSEGRARLRTVSFQHDLLIKYLKADIGREEFLQIQSEFCYRLLNI